MKKVCIVLLLSLVVCAGFSQSNSDSSKHLVFKGVPIDGPLSQYVAKMKQSGFKIASSKVGLATLQGDFAGHKDCYIGVSTLSQKDLVYKIVVLFPAKETWGMLSGNYYNLKEMLTEKYGKPAEVVERFDGAGEPNDDGTKMQYVGLDWCKFISTWETDKGDIQLSIMHNSVLNSFVSLAYFDKINGAAIKKQAIDDL